MNNERTKMTEDNGKVNDDQMPTTTPTLPATSTTPDSDNMFRNCKLLSEIPDELMVPGCFGRGYCHDENATKVGLGRCEVLLELPDTL